MINNTCRQRQHQCLFVDERTLEIIFDGSIKIKFMYGVGEEVFFFKAPEETTLLFHFPKGAFSLELEIQWALVTHASVKLFVH